MPLLYMMNYNRDFIRTYGDWLFVFGDNFERVGYGGQAKEARGEPNAVGIPTKRKPSNDADAFLTNDHFYEWQRLTQKDFQRLGDHVIFGGIVIWPYHDIGTGLARLPAKAPLIHKSISEFRYQLELVGNQLKKHKAQ